jgi:hypothetical protein
MLNILKFLKKNNNLIIYTKNITPIITEYKKYLMKKNLYMITSNCPCSDINNYNYNINYLNLDIKYQLHRNYNGEFKNIINNTKTLIIENNTYPMIEEFDPIKITDMEKLNEILKDIKGNNKLFGDIQIILSTNSNHNYDFEYNFTKIK